jgi:hypothetical protein
MQMGYNIQLVHVIDRRAAIEPQARGYWTIGAGFGKARGDSTIGARPLETCAYRDKGTRLSSDRRAGTYS